MDHVAILVIQRLPTLASYDDDHVLRATILLGLVFGEERQLLATLLYRVRPQ